MHACTCQRRQAYESGSVKFFVKANGDATLERQGRLTAREATMIRKFIKKNYREMYLKWKEYSTEDFYGRD